MKLSTIRSANAVATQTRPPPGVFVKSLKIGNLFLQECEKCGNSVKRRLKTKELGGEGLGVFAKFQKSQEIGDLGDFGGGRESGAMPEGVQEAATQAQKYVSTGVTCCQAKSTEAGRMLLGSV